MRRLGGTRKGAALLGPPPGAEASVHEIQGEEFLVFRIPLREPELRGELSAAEREVAALAFSGLSNADIARRRRTSARTVANQMGAIFRKLGVRSRAELARRLVRGEEP